MQFQFPEEGSTQPRTNKTGVVSCRLPFELKLAAEKLASERGLVLSHLLRDFLAETVKRQDPNWWRDGAAPEEPAPGAYFMEMPEER